MVCVRRWISMIMDMVVKKLDSHYILGDREDHV